LLEPALQDGRLVEILQPWRVDDSMPLTALYPPGRQHQAKLTAMLDFAGNLRPARLSTADQLQRRVLPGHLQGQGGRAAHGFHQQNLATGFARLPAGTTAQNHILSAVADPYAALFTLKCVWQLAVQADHFAGIQYQCGHLACSPAVDDSQLRGRACRPVATQLQITAMTVAVLR
jgi:hypothetical protein